MKSLIDIEGFNKKNTSIKMNNKIIAIIILEKKNTHTWMMFV